MLPSYINNPIVIDQTIKDNPPLDKVKSSIVLQMLFDAGLNKNIDKALIDGLFDPVRLKILLPKYTPKTFTDLIKRKVYNSTFSKFLATDNLLTFKIIYPYIETDYYPTLIKKVIYSKATETLKYLLTQIEERDFEWLSSDIDLEVARVFLDAGIEITPGLITDVIYNNNLSMFNLLLEHDPEINNDHWVEIIYRNRISMFQYLMEAGYGEQFSQLPINNEHPLFYSNLSGNEILPFIKILFSYITNQELLIQLYVDHTYSNVQFFIDKGLRLADYSEKLIDYIEYENTQVVEQLLKNGVDIHYNNDEALRSAVDLDNVDMVKLLLDYKADPMANNDQAYRKATMYKYMGIVYLLFEYYKTQPNTFIILEDSEQCRDESQVDFHLQPREGPMFGYGNYVDGFYCLSLSEIITQITNQDFRNPYNHNQVFTLYELQDISILLEDGSYNFPEEDMERFNIFMLGYTIQENQYKEEIIKLRAVEDKTYLRELFVYLFAIGMYFRQWKGPGHPYPLLAQQTGKEFRKVCIEETHFLQALGIMHNKYLHALSRLPKDIYDIYQSLPSQEIISGHLQQKENIQEIYNKTINIGENCIRMTSNTFIITGAYYLKVILDEDIPDYTLRITVEHIF